MVKKTILRLAEGIQFPNALKSSKDEVGTTSNQVLPIEFEANLKEIIGPFELETYPERRNLQRSYQRRIDSLSKAFSFILDTIPEFKEVKSGLEYYQERCLANHTLPENKSINEYQDILAQFTADLLSGLSYYSPYEEESKKKISLAIELLNIAEQYVIMSDGKADLATLIPMNLSESMTYALRYEKQIEPYTKESLDEFAAIKKASLVTPNWYREYSYPLQMYLLACPNVKPETEKESSSIIAEFKGFIESWGQIKTKNSSTLATHLSDIANNKLPNWFNKLQSHQQQLLRSLIGMNKDADAITEALNSYKKELGPSKKYLKKLPDIQSLPYWYLTLKEYEQRFLIGALKSKERIEDAISFLPSRLRRLPLPANFFKTHFIFMNNAVKPTKKYPTRIRSSHFRSRDVQEEPEVIQDLHGERNLARIAEQMDEDDIFLFMQTLISPFSWLKKYMPDYYLDEGRKRTIQKFQEKNDIQILSMNHPLNIGKYVQYASTSNKECMNTLNLVKVILLVKNISTLPQWTVKEIENELSLASNTNVNANTSKTTEQNIIHARKQLADLCKKNENLLSSTSGWQKMLSRHLFLRQTYTTKEQITAYMNNLNELQTLAEEYENVLNSPFGTATVYDHNARELFISSLGSLLPMFAKGKVGGSCVSGKDRKDIETTHTLAMIAFREKKGYWPKLSDTGQDRADFVEMVATLEVSGHGDEHAGQNAPGCEGKKHPANYWPKDIADAIRKKSGENSLKESNILATNNEVENIKDSQKNAVKNLVKPNYSSCFVAAHTLTQEERVELLTFLKLLLGENSFFNTRTYNLLGSITTTINNTLGLFAPGAKNFEEKNPKAAEEAKAPKGIETLKKIVNTPGIDLAKSTEKITNVFWEISLRPEGIWAKWLRDDDIKKIYYIFNLIREKPSEFREAMVSLNQVKDLSFTANATTAPIPT